MHKCAPKLVIVKYSAFTNQARIILTPLLLDTVVSEKKNALGRKDFESIEQGFFKILEESTSCLRKVVRIYRLWVPRGSVVKSCALVRGILDPRRFFRGSVFGHDTSEPQPSTGETQERCE